MQRRLVIFVWVFAALAVPAASAQELTPDGLVKTVTQDVIAVIKQDKAIQAGDRKKTIALVEEKVLPHFNFTRMTALAMGPNWRKATPEQQQALVNEFRTLLVRTYSTALSAYRNQVIEVKPLRAKPDDADVMVRSEVKQSGTEPVTLDYSMEKTPNGWKVYDVAVGGVSLVTTYRDAFANEVRNVGVDGLIKALAEKNRQLETKRS
ncbi:MAG TPA: ABC transporter substrate-binding protein [Burkholderiales bacterium]|nr:ABC transporter substrate-binding protein [Burkholderiales bacterium]